MYIDFVERDNSWSRLCGIDINYIDIFNLICDQDRTLLIGRTSTGEWYRICKQLDTIEERVYSASFRLDYIYHNNLYMNYKRRSKLERICNE